MKALLIAAASALLLIPFRGREACACSPKVVSYMSAMRSDLRNLAELQDDYRRRNTTYASALAALFFLNARGDTIPYQGSTGVTVVLERGDSSGWVARARHDRMPQTCVAGIGPLAPVNNVTLPHHTGVQMACDRLVDPYRVRPTLGAAVLSLAVVILAATFVKRSVARRRGPSTRGKLLILMAFVHPLWWIFLAGNGLMAPDCGTMVSFAALLFAVSAAIVTVREWRDSRPRPA